MNRPLYFLIAVVLATLLTGCETTDQGIPAKQLQSNLSSIKLGMTKDQVVALIGKPVRVNESLDASGAAEQFIYTESQFWTPGQAIAVGMMRGAGGPAGESVLILNFKKGRLVSKQKQGA